MVIPIAPRQARHWKSWRNSSRYAEGKSMGTDSLSMNRMKCVRATIGRSGLLIVALMTGCAKHADFVDLREEVTNLTKTQEQTQKRQEALQRRLETGKPIPVDETSKGHDTSGQRIQELTNRLADLESRLSRRSEERRVGREGGARGAGEP